MFNGDFFKPQSIVSEEDIKALEAYNAQVNSGIKGNEAFDSTMKNASQTAQDLAKSAKGAAVDINAIPKASKAAAVGMKALSVAGNMLASALISLAITAIFKGVDYLIHRTEKLQEALQKSTEEFNATTEELKSLEDELKKTTKRLDELQKLADNGTISIAEESELETLKETNKELSRKIALKQQEQAQEARDLLRDSKKNSTLKVDSEYKEQTTSSGNYTYKVDVLPSEELEMAIEAYNNADEALDNPDRNKELDWFYEGQRENASNRIEEMYALISPVIGAYEDLINAGIELEGEDKTHYEQLKKTQDAYLLYIYALNGTREAFEGLNAEQQRSILLNRLTEQGLSEDIAKAIVGSISDEDLSKYWDKNFSFVPPEMKDGESAEQYGKRYAEAWLKGLQDGIKDDNEATVSLEDLNTASESIATLSRAFKELSDDGYITIQTLEDIRKATGLSEEAWKEYQSKLIAAEVGSDEFNQILSDLTYKILANKFATAELNEVTEEEIGAILRENGVIADASLLLGRLRLEKSLLNKEQIDTSSEAEEILNLANSANASAASIKKLTRAVEYLKKAEKSEAAGEHRMADYYRSQAQVYLGMPVEYDKISFDHIKYTNSSSSSKSNEALDNYLKDAENRYKIHQDEIKYIQELQYAYSNLTKDEKERLDITGKINEAYRDRADNRIKDIEHQIDLAKELHGDDVDVTGYYDQIQQVAREESNRLHDMGYGDSSNEIQDLQKTWWDAQNSKLDFYNKQHENIIRDIEHARDMALEQNPYLDTTSYYKQMQDEYHKQAEYLRALDPEKYKEEIQKLQQAWWSAQKSIADWSYSNSERWISERNTYNDWELYDDNEIAAWERVLKRFQTEFPNELEKIKGIEQKIFEARKAAMEKSISDIEDYIDARNSYNDWDAYSDNEVKAVQRQTKIIEQAYRDRLLSYEEYVDRLEEQTQRIYSLGQSQVDKHLSNIDNYIDARNHYNDWDTFGDSETNAIKRQLEILDEAYRLNLISLEDYTKKTEEYTKRLYSAAKNNIVETISELVEDYEEMKQLESSQLESQKTLLQSYYDVVNAIAEAQHEINKELRASQSMYEYLNEDTRELLFNQEDYNALNEELLNIQAEADELQKQYQEDILNADAEIIAEITEQYQMQYATIMKKYEIAKAELEVAKKRQKLDNVLAERNTRMFINGQWQWVAKTQDVINAQNELADAEIERKKQEASLEQTEAVNNLTTQINSLETDLNKVRKWWSDMQEMLNGESDEVAKALKEISSVSSPELKRIIEVTGGNVGSFSTILSESTATLSDIVNGDLGLVTVSTGIGNIITDLENYSIAIQALIDKLNGATSGSSGGRYLQVGADGNAPAGATIGDIIVTAGGNFKIVPANTPGATYNPESGHWSVKVSSSSSGGGGGSSSGGSSSSGGRVVQVGSDGNAPAGTEVGDIVKTSAGNYLVVPYGTEGSTYNPASGLSSIKIEEENADGTRYTSGGTTLMGEEGFEAFISNTGRLIPISQPTIGNIGAGGIVFNREQMANLRNLWDLSNLGKTSHFVSSSSANNQSTIIDNSIHIGGMTVGEQGNEDWINGLRRYVATHK